MSEMLDARVGAARICAELLKAQVPNLEAGQLAELAGGAVDASAVRGELKALVAELETREAMPDSAAALIELTRRQLEAQPVTAAAAGDDEPVSGAKPGSVAAQVLTNAVCRGANAAILSEAHVRDNWPLASMPNAPITMNRQRLVFQLVYLYLCGAAGVGS